MRFLRFGARLALLVLVSATPGGAQLGESSSAELGAIIELASAGDLPGAETALRELLNQSDSGPGRDLLGMILSRQGRPNEAEAEFRRALTLAPDLHIAQQHLARLLLQQGRSEEGLEALRQAAEVGNLERDLALQLAAMETQGGDLSAAEIQLRAAATQHGSVRARVQLARLLARQGDHSAAAKELNAALERAPHSEEVLHLYAKSSLAGGAPVEAIRALEPLARMHPQNAEYPYLLGVARLHIGDGDGAGQALERSRTLQSGRALTLTALGLALNLQRRFPEARSILEEALVLEPTSLEARAALAEAEAGLGNIEAAQANALAVLEQTNHAGAYLALGQVRMNQGRFEEARDLLLRTVELQPDASKAHYQLSLAYARLNEAESSKRHLQLYRESLDRTEQFLARLRAGGLVDEE